MEGFIHVLRSPSPTPAHPYLPMSLSVTSLQLCNASGDGDSATSLHSLCHCITTLSENKFFPNTQPEAFQYWFLRRVTKDMHLSASRSLSKNVRAWSSPCIPCQVISAPSMLQRGEEMALALCHRGERFWVTRCEAGSTTRR